MLVAIYLKRRGLIVQGSDCGGVMLQEGGHLLRSSTETKCRSVVILVVSGRRCLAAVDAFYGRRKRKPDLIIFKEKDRRQNTKRGWGWTAKAEDSVFGGYNHFTGPDKAKGGDLAN